MKKLFVVFMFTVLYAQLEAAQPRKETNCHNCRPRWVIVDHPDEKKPKLPQKSGDTLPLNGEQTGLRKMITKIHDAQDLVDATEEDLAGLLINSSPSLQKKIEEKAQARAQTRAQRGAFAMGVASTCLLFASLCGLLYR